MILSVRWAEARLAHATRRPQGPTRSVPHALYTLRSPGGPPSRGPDTRRTRRLRLVPGLSRGRGMRPDRGRTEGPSTQVDRSGGGPKLDPAVVPGGVTGPDADSMDHRGGPGSLVPRARRGGRVVGLAPRRPPGQPAGQRDADPAPGRGTRLGPDRPGRRGHGPRPRQESRRGPPGARAGLVRAGGGRHGREHPRLRPSAQHRDAGRGRPPAGDLRDGDQAQAVEADPARPALARAGEARRGDRGEPGGRRTRTSRGSEGRGQARRNQSSHS